MTSFIHLHVHSEFSLIDGVVRIKPLMKQLAAAGMPAVALTDQSNLFAAVKFYRAATAAGIKPIFGADLYIENKEEGDAPHRITALCQNQEGFHGLTELISKGYTEGQHHGKAVVQREWLFEKSAGLIILSGADKGDIGAALLAGKPEEAAQSLQQWMTHFPDCFYLEIQRTQRPHDNDVTLQSVRLAEQADCPIVATNDVCFIDSEDFDAHEARVCIHDGFGLSDERRPKRYSSEQYLKSEAQMQALFEDLPTALENTVEIAKRCNVHFDLGKNYLPNFPVPDGMSIEQYLQELSEQGLESRLKFILDSEADDYQAQRHPYFERLLIELEVINSMGFPGYFLIVADFIQWAKDNGVPVGPGRGSGAGSLVAYALGITDLDPLEYGLLFERFLNPERVSMPDFDIDFCMEGRDRVIEYVANYYGRESVSQIITFGTMAAKAVVRDVGRVLGHPYGFVDKIAKLIPFEIGITLDKALEQEEELQSRYDKEEEVRLLIDLARKLEGVTRNAGKHAGGVVIAPSKLTDFSPLFCEEGSTQIVTQYDKDDVEAVGLVKFDFLGLRTLTIIDWAIQTINEKRQKNNEPPIDISKIPTVDEPSFDLLKACQTTAVFQLESRGMKDLIKRLQPDCFEEIIALVALFRPGPLQSGMVDDFINRKHGLAKVEYPHPDLASILQPTYGIILYQEQVMQIAQVLANYTLGGADLLRRAMGKKKPEEMAKQRDIFTKGASDRGVDVETSTSIFDLIEKFAGYGFNKSHSAAYALVAYQTAWLKAHYPAAFMASVLSSDMDNTDKVVIFLDECKQMQLTVLTPNVNQSFYKFTVTDDDKILYGLGAIKGVGEAALELLIQEREANGAYQDLFDLCCRVDLRKVNRRVLEALIRAGAFDDLGPHRAALFVSLASALKNAEQHKANNLSGQNDLFAVMDENAQSTSADFVETKPWSQAQMLKGEKETLGIYLSGHPIDYYLKELQHITHGPLASLRASGDKSTIVAGYVVSVRKLLTKRGKKMAVISLEDHTGKIDVTLFSEVYETSVELLEKDNLLVVQGEASHDDFSGGIRVLADRIWTMTAAREQFAKRIQIRLQANDAFENQLTEIQQALASYRPGVCPICIDYHQSDGQALFVLGKQWRVEPRDACLEQLLDVLGEEDIELIY